MCDCFKIGGPWIAEDPDCPVHGTERVKEDTLEDRIEQLEEMQRKLQQALELIAVGDVSAPAEFCRDTLVELGFWNITDPDANGYRPPAAMVEMLLVPNVRPRLLCCRC